MKKRNTLFVAAIFVLTTAFVAGGDDCDMYYPSVKGKSITYEQYDKKNQLTGTTIQKVIDVKSIDGGKEITLGVIASGAANDTTISRQFTVTCAGGTYSISMDQFLDPQTLAAYEGMEMVVESDNLDLPKNPVAGQMLKGGDITVKVMNSGIQIFGLTVTVSNRKVAAVEDITTPAGTFNCAKITYDVESKIAFIKVKASGAEWYSKGAGMVKSESYDKKGKLESWQQITSIEG